jgi:hypothetical protein
MSNLDEFNGVRSVINDQGTNPPVGSVSRNSTFIFGTAKSGPRHTPVRVTKDNVKTIFGDVPLDSSFDTSLVRGYYEYVQSCKSNPDVTLIRVGTTKTARIDLYENTLALSGELSYTLDADNNNLPSKSMFIMALAEGAEMNKTKIEVMSATDSEGDPTGDPAYMKVVLPNGTYYGFNISATSSAPGVITKVSELCTAINSNATLSKYIAAGFKALTSTISLVVTEDVNHNKIKTYEITTSGQLNTSYSDKLISVMQASYETNVASPISAGSLVGTLTTIPEKIMEGADTITKFIRKSTLEPLVTVTPDIVGRTNYTKNLACMDVAGWDSSYDIRSNSDDGWTLEVYAKRSGSSTNTKLTLTTDYTVTYSSGSNTARIVLVKALALGDRYYVTYRYKVNYSEAKRRSELSSGSDRSFFISGNQIIFGAAQPSDLIAYYDANVIIDASEVTIESYKTPIITFNNGSALPDVGETFNVTIMYEPELPAPTGTVFTGINSARDIQPGALTGGSDGRLITKEAYKTAVIDAFNAVDLYPRANNVIMGCYLDDAAEGYDDETGALIIKPINMWADFLPLVEKTSKYTNECVMEIPVRPITDLKADTIVSWIDKLTNTSNTDLTRPANIIDGISNYRAEAPLGVFIISVPEINGGKRYFANPACIYAAYKQTLALSSSAVHGFLPGNVLDLGVKIFNAEVIGKLNSKRYTAAILDENNRFIWADAPTLALKYRSQYDRQFVRDAVYYAISLARAVCAKYIGKPRTSTYLVAMKKDVLKALNPLAPDILSDFFAEIVPVADGYITGATKIRLNLVTAKEIRSIEIETNISLVE